MNESMNETINIYVEIHWTFHGFRNLVAVCLAISKQIFHVQCLMPNKVILLFIDLLAKIRSSNEKK